MVDLFAQHFEDRDISTIAHVETILAELQVVVSDNHFVYTAGDHGDMYVNKDRVTLFPEPMKKIARIMIDLLKNTQIDVVVAPAVGGIALGQWIAHEMRVSPDFSNPLSVLADKENGIGFAIRRNYDKLIAHRRVIIVEDIVNSGKTTRELVAEISRLEGRLLGVVAMYNRGGVTAQDLGFLENTFHRRFFLPLIDRQMKKYAADDCPLCMNGKTINTDLGHGRHFVEKHGQPKAV
ncbi:MAG: hypothetical protein CMI52_03800 [Parcubacteria group bacterium]|nr:hypothetical protein [Parcubacteria group bacterium]|tara:strand:- start:259 stop:966 length:708 start_codon:yes stop_codon:yes gene_type:complete